MLKLGNSYLGFTDNKTPMQKARIEGTLDKKKRFKQDGIVAMKQMIFNLIMDGRITEDEAIENFNKIIEDSTDMIKKSIKELIDQNGLSPIYEIGA